MKAWPRVGQLALIGILLPLTACAVNSPAQIRASEGRISQADKISLMAEEDEAPLRRGFRLALQRSFADHDTLVDADAPLVADFGISAVDARVGQVSEIAPPSSDAALVWQAKPRRGMLLDSCKPMRAQATLAIFDRQKGELIYRGEAEATVCNSSEDDLAQLAERLVGDAKLRADPGL